MDHFETLNEGLESPVRHGESVTPNDAQDLPAVTRAIWVGSQGNLAVELASGNRVTFKDAVGWMPLRAKRILATNTTATDIVGVW